LRLSKLKLKRQAAEAVLAASSLTCAVMIFSLGDLVWDFGLVNLEKSEGL
jgi:hypothetical protein